MNKCLVTELTTQFTYNLESLEYFVGKTVFFLKFRCEMVYFMVYHWYFDMCTSCVCLYWGKNVCKFMFSQIHFVFPCIEKNHNPFL